MLSARKRLKLSTQSDRCFGPWKKLRNSVCFFFREMEQARQTVCSRNNVAQILASSCLQPKNTDYAFCEVRMSSPDVLTKINFCVENGVCTFLCLYSVFVSGSRSSSVVFQEQLGGATSRQP